MGDVRQHDLYVGGFLQVPRDPLPGHGHRVWRSEYVPPLPLHVRKKLTRTLQTTLVC